MNSPTKTVHRIHFEDFDGRQFERLIFAYHIRSERWRSLEWYGQVGSDLGRDIWGIQQNDPRSEQTVCIQCANRKTLPSTKAIRDIDKVLNSPNGKPDIFRLVCSSPVSAKIRDKIKAHAKAKKILNCDVWSGEEFEERLRADCEFLLKRFIDGDVFPDDSNKLKQFVENTSAIDDHEILGLIARAFDRPAFRTPFHGESYLPDFKQAITDTIQVLNTGIWQTRDGKEIGRIPSRHDVKDIRSKAVLKSIESQLVKLRSRFDELLKSKKIKHCGCSEPTCPYYMSSPDAIREMDELRSEILSQFHQIHPEFSVRVGWHN